MRALIKSVLHHYGLEIHRKLTVPAPAHEDTMLGGMIRASKQMGVPATVIDVGAAQGTWTMSSLNIWADSQYVLFEPLEERKQELLELKKRYPNVHLVHAGAGERETKLAFYVTEDLDGSGIADNGTHARTRQIDITTIDGEVDRLRLPGPFVIKLDTHGHEVPILEGAVSTLKQTQLLVVECYGFQIAPNSLMFWEMCQLMLTKGFRLFDVVDVMRRARDGAFWQCDAFFVPANHQIFQSNTYVNQRTTRAKRIN